MASESNNHKASSKWKWMVQHRRYGLDRSSSLNGKESPLWRSHRSWRPCQRHNCSLHRYIPNAQTCLNAVTETQNGLLIGENVEPLEIEEAAMRSRLIDQIVVIGQVLKLSLKRITKILVSASICYLITSISFTGSTTPWSYHNPKQRGSRKARSWNTPT